MYDYMENPYVIQMEYEPYRIIAFDPVTEDEQVVFVDTPLKIIGNIFQNPNLIKNNKCFSIRRLRLPSFFTETFKNQLPYEKTQK